MSASHRALVDACQRGSRTASNGAATIDEQLRRQLGEPMPLDPLAGLDVAVSLRIDDQRIAAVWRVEDISLQGSLGRPKTRGSCTGTPSSAWILKYVPGGCRRARSR